MKSVTSFVTEVFFSFPKVLITIILTVKSQLKKECNRLLSDVENIERHQRAKEFSLVNIIINKINFKQ